MARSAKGLRTVKLLSFNSQVKIDPSEWRQERGAKQFDESNTAILRVFKHTKLLPPSPGEKKSKRTTNGTFMVYGMRSVDGKKEAEAYEMVVLEEQVAAAVERVAKACGVESLVGAMA